MRLYVGRFLRKVVGIYALPILVVYALRERQNTLDRQQRGEKPRLVYGPTPIINIKFARQAMEHLGYEARTFVYDIYHIHTRDDFDYHIDDLFSGLSLPHWLKRKVASYFGQYVAFLWLLPRFDVFHYFYHGGFLQASPLRFLEVQLLHLAGKKVVVTPYGNDAAVPTHTSSLLWRHGLMMHYRDVGRDEPETLRRIAYLSKRADFIVAPIFHLETLPRWDLLTTGALPIDTDTWQADNVYSSADGRNGCVSIVHAPNHRGLKGTDFLIAACRELQSEGYQVELRLLERVPNSEVRRVMSESDIVAETFIHGYMLTALEGMSLAKPVLSNLSDDHYYQVHRLYTGMDECPILSTPPEKIKENLRTLITDPELRRRLGQEGRRYVLKYHSAEALSRMWDAIYRKIWHGERIELTAWHPDRCRPPAVEAERI